MQVWIDEAGVNGLERKIAFADAANLAVEKMLHRCKRNEYHKRYPPGRCPLCTSVQNAINASRFRERLWKIAEPLSEGRNE